MAAKLRIKNGSIQIVQNAIDNDAGEMVTIIRAGMGVNIQFSKKHSHPLAMADADVNFKATDLSDAAQAALKTVVDEITGKVKEAAVKKAAEICKEMGVPFEA